MENAKVCADDYHMAMSELLAGSMVRMTPEGKLYSAANPPSSAIVRP